MTSATNCPPSKPIDIDMTLPPDQILLNIAAGILAPCRNHGPEHLGRRIMQISEQTDAATLAFLATQKLPEEIDRPDAVALMHSVCTLLRSGMITLCTQGAPITDDADLFYDQLMHVMAVMAKRVKIQSYDRITGERTA